MSSSVNLTGQTATVYEIEMLADRYGTQEWGRTSHGYFDAADEAREVAAGITGTTRIARIEITRTVVV